MNALNMAKAAYAPSQSAVRTPRATEYEAFARATHRLKAAAAQGKEGFSRLVGAVHDNRQLWTLLAADVAENENGLPQDLRARIFYLAEFTAQYSRKILSEDADPDVLIDINTAIMRGLRNQAKAA